MNQNLLHGDLAMMQAALSRSTDIHSSAAAGQSATLAGHEDLAPSWIGRAGTASLTQGHNHDEIMNVTSRGHDELNVANGQVIVNYDTAELDSVGFLNAINT
ncbi:hypothetical protein [Actinophytocola gossypii]|uniref:Uncharacterized protein n=1 Tax=Actinophytocola gossypii TaxID=2812003 RepID=A0ABT2JDE9_9PSEU|nr:hypothetical protein [Actinophytocola gossypii]MCT2585899.1 hypothetical protein [Actinophytocola gossypii]